MIRKSRQLVIIGLYLAASAATVNAEETKPTFLRDGKLIACTNPGFPPMEFMADASADRPSGIDIEIANALGKLWNVETTYSISDFNGLLTSLATGRCGIMISGYYIAEERPFDQIGYMETSSVIVTSGTNSDIKTPEDLSGKSVTIEVGTTIYADIVKDLNAKFASQGRPLVKLSSYPSQASAAEQVLLGRADANLSDVVEASVRTKQTGGRLSVCSKKR